MTDEEVLTIAHGLTEDDWLHLAVNVRYHEAIYCHDDALLVDIGCLEIYHQSYRRWVYVTPLGYQVWEWRDLFWSPDSPGFRARSSKIEG
jgi:hypothetical protein